MINQARTADLYQYLWENHPDCFKKTERNLYLKGNNSLVIRNGNYGYKDYATCETGNGIDFLTGYLGYSFQEAVFALASRGYSQLKDTAATYAPTLIESQFKTFQLPVAAMPPYSRAYAFLMKRHIPKGMIDMLVNQSLLYQSDKTNNIVFVNPERDYYELRGTYTYTEKSFHGCGKTRSDRFWYLKGGRENCDTVYITEGAIDAISLFLLQKKQRIDTSRTAFASIGGVSNYSTIERIAHYKHAILAVDNDDAGERCRNRFPNLEFILPNHKDWNDDLVSLTT